jgi:hypothetical protein
VVQFGFFEAVPEPVLEMELFVLPGLTTNQLPVADRVHATPKNIEHSRHFMSHGLRISVFHDEDKRYTAGTQHAVGGTWYAVQGENIGPARPGSDGGMAGLPVCLSKDD